MNDHPAIEAEARRLIGALGARLPDTLAAFGQLANATFREGPLDLRTKELIALGIAIAAGCDGCMAWHNAALARLGVTLDEVADAAGVAVEMGGGIALYRAAKAVEGYAQFLQAGARPG
ncbi:MAG: carboxymuconolactone decarboxylase family protein [Gammaproteobacteria bacterium]